ncbi:DNA-directed DNA polymerase [Tanacetum coccineum]
MEAVSSPMVAAAKLPVLNPGEFELWKMRIEQYFLMTDYALWEVIVNGDSPPPKRTVDGVEQTYPPTTAEEKLARKNELKARGTSFGFHPFQFSYSQRKLTMEEMLYKFINEGRREHEEMRAFIREFKTTNELLLNERNMSLSELKFEVKERKRRSPTMKVLRKSETAPHKHAIHRSPFPNAKVRQISEGTTIKQNQVRGGLHGASISLMPYTMYKKLGLGEPKPTRMSLELADRSIQYLRGIAENILIKIGKFILPFDFVILDMREDSMIPIILERPFLATARAMIDVFNKNITLRVGNEEVIFDVDQSIKRPPTEDDECYGIDYLDTTIHLKTQELFDQLDSFLVNNLEKSIDQSNLESCGKADDGSGSETPIRRIKQVLEKRKGEIAWKMSDIKGISPSFYTYKILMAESFNPVIQPQQHLNPKVQDVVKNKLVKLLDLGLIYPISDSPWVSPIHAILKKGGMTVVLNDNNELIPSRTVTGWRVCIDYRKLNDATRKDHFPLPFIDQMLERLSGNEYYCFLDCFSRFFQIPIAPEDQEKTTFTCPYGTCSYRRMPFGLCNVPATFQRCMTAIFHDMVEDFMEVFMDDFSVFGQKISGKGIEVDKAKIDVIAKLPYLKNVKGVRCFLGHAGKQDTKPRLIRWVLLLQGFNIEIKDKKGAENLYADHLSRLENQNMGELAEEEIADKFPDEHLMILKANLNEEEPWYADYVNYIVGKVVPPKWTPKRRKQFFSQARNYFWDEPYAFRLCPDYVMRRCVAGDKILEILAHCHSGLTGGHHSALVTGRKVSGEVNCEEDENCIVKPSYELSRRGDDEDDGASRASTPSPTTYLNSLGPLNYQQYDVSQRLFEENDDLLFERQTDLINQTQQMHKELRGGFKSFGKALRGVFNKKKK